MLENSSCKSVLAKFNLRRIQNGENPISTNSGAYTRAKNRLNINVLKKIALRHEKVAPKLLWQNRTVKVVDGTTFQMEDTLENQNRFPQNPSQKKGLGQPIMRVLGIFSLSSGEIVDIETAPYMGKGTAEPSLLRRMIERFSASDVLLMDRFFTSYFLHSELEKRGVDFLVRL